MNTAQELKLLGLMPETALHNAKDADVPQELRENAPNGEYHCANPTYRDDEIASSDPDTVNECLGLEDREFAEHVIEMHKQAPPKGSEQAGSGSWPAGCPHVSQWYQSPYHAATYYVERSTFSSNWKRPVLDSEYQFILDLAVYDEQHGGPWGRIRSVDDCKRAFVYTTEEAANDAGVSVGDPLDVLDLCCLLMEEINRRVGCAYVRVYTGPEGKHNVHIRGKEMPGSLAGYAYFNNGTCGDHVNLFLDNLLGQDFQFAINLTAHESGHTMNLEHQFNGQGTHHELMSYSSIKWTAQGYSTGDPPYRLPRAPSLRPLQSHFDWQTRIPPPLTETPEQPPPTTDRIELPGELIGEVVDGKAVFRGFVTISAGFKADRNIRLIVTPNGDGTYSLKEPLGV